MHKNETESDRIRNIRMLAFGLATNQQIKTCFSAFSTIDARQTYMRLLSRITQTPYRFWLDLKFLFFASLCVADEGKPPRTAKYAVKNESHRICSLVALKRY